MTSYQCLRLRWRYFKDWDWKKIISRFEIERTSYKGLRLREHPIKGWDWENITSSVEIERKSYQGLRLGAYHIKGWDWENIVFHVEIERTSYGGLKLRKHHKKGWDWENIIKRIEIEMISYKGLMTSYQVLRLSNHHINILTWGLPSWGDLLPSAATGQRNLGPHWQIPAFQTPRGGRLATISNWRTDQ